MKLGFNHTRSFAELLNDAIDTALTGENAMRPRRDYLGGSRVGHACERALQFEFAGAPKDDGADFPGRTLRIFAIGHALEDLQFSGCAPRALISTPARAIAPMVSSSAFRSRTAAFVAMSTASLLPPPGPFHSVCLPSGNARP